MNSEITRNLLGGISQQPEDLRAPNQAQEAKNIVFDPVEGASKRYPSNHVASIDTNRQNQKHLFSMDREDQQYLIWAGDSEINAYQTDGTEVPMVDSTNGGAGFVPKAATLTYLNGDRDTLRSQVIVDSAFIVNTGVTVTSETYAATTPDWRNTGTFANDRYANVFVRQFNWSSRATVRWKVEGFDEQRVEYSSPSNLTGYSSGQTWADVGIYAVTMNGPVVYNFALDGWVVRNGSFVGDPGEPEYYPVCDSADGLFAHTAGNTAPENALYPKGSFTYDVATGVARLKPGITDPATQLYFGWDLINDPGLHATGGANITIRTSKAAQNQNNLQQIGRSFPVRADFVAEYLKNEISDMTLVTSGVSVIFPSIANSTGSAWFQLRGQAPFEVFEVTDNVDNTYADGWISEVEDITDLPKTCRHGTIARISNTESELEYFVAFRTEKFERDDLTVDDNWAAYDEIGTGTWVEFVPGLNFPSIGSTDEKDALTASTMPHLIRRITVTSAMMADGTFTTNWPDATLGSICFDVRPYDSWEPRRVGYEDNNETPSFVDSTIADVFFWQGRLGFLSDDNIILSEAGNTDNFWRTTQLSVPDSDRIDVASTENQGKTLRYAVPLDERLMVFSDDTQVVLTSNGVLAPSTVEAPIASNYEGLKNATPILFGRSVLFPYKNHSYVGLRELVPLDRRENFAPVELTSHITRWIDAGTSHKVVASTSENMLFFHSDANPDRLYVLRYVKGSQGDYQMAAWSDWDFPMDILDFTLLNDALYLIFDNRNGETAIERIDLGSGQNDSATSGEDWLTHLDRKFYWDGADPAVSASHAPGPDHTTFTFSVPDGMYEAEYTSGLKAYTVDGVVLDDSGHGTNPGGTHYRVNGNYEGVPLWFGVPYEMRWVSNRVNPRVPATGGNTPRLSRRTINNNAKISFDRTGFFETTVRYHTGPTFVTTFSGDAANNISYGSTDRFDASGTDKIRTGTIQVPVHGANQNIRFVISTDSPLPCRLTNLEWTSTQRPKNGLKGVW